MSIELFSPHGSQPLAGVRLSNPKHGKIEFDRSVRGNVLALEGDVTGNRLFIPESFQPASSASATVSAASAGAPLTIAPIIVLQIFAPSSGQCGIELYLLHSGGGGSSSSQNHRSRLTIATFIGKPELADAKGVPHMRVPLAVPRNMWTQVAIHIPGMASDVFHLPAPLRAVEAVVLSGSLRIRRVAAAPDEASALEKPGGMLLFTLPAYGPPTWTTSATSSQPQQQQHQQQQPSTTTTTHQRRFPGGGGASSNSTQDQAPITTATSSSQPLASQPPNTTIMRFTRDAEGNIRFVATNEALERQRKEAEMKQQQQKLRMKGDAGVDEGNHDDDLEQDMSSGVMSEGGSWEQQGTPKNGAAAAGTGGRGLLFVEEDAALDEGQPNHAALPSWARRVVVRQPAYPISPLKTKVAPSTYIRLVDHQPTSMVGCAAGGEPSPNPSGGAVAPSSAPASLGRGLLRAGQGSSTTTGGAAASSMRKPVVTQRIPPSGAGGGGGGVNSLEDSVSGFGDEDIDSALGLVGGGAEAVGGPSGAPPPTTPRSGQQRSSQFPPVNNRLRQQQAAAGPSTPTRSGAYPRMSAASGTPPPPTGDNGEAEHAALLQEAVRLAAAGSGGSSHPADSYVPVQRAERPLGFGVGNLDIEHHAASGSDDDDDDTDTSQSESDDDDDDTTTAKNRAAKGPVVAAPRRGGVPAAQRGGGATALRR